MLQQIENQEIFRRERTKLSKYFQLLLRAGKQKVIGILNYQQWPKSELKIYNRNCLYCALTLHYVFHLCKFEINYKV